MDVREFLDACAPLLPSLLSQALARTGDAVEAEAACVEAVVQEWRRGTPGEPPDPARLERRVAERARRYTSRGVPLGLELKPPEGGGSPEERVRESAGTRLPGETRRGAGWIEPLGELLRPAWQRSSASRRKVGRIAAAAVVALGVLVIWRPVVPKLLPPPRHAVTPLPRAVLFPQDGPAPSRDGPMRIGELRMFGEDHGWATFIVGNQNVLAETDDGGFDWTPVHRWDVRDGDYLVSFVDPDQAVLVKRTQVQCGETPPRSEILGLSGSWLPHSIGPFAGDVISMQFVDSSHGFIATSPACIDDSGTSAVELYRTEDGGRTWIPATLPSPGAPRYNPSSDQRTQWRGFVQTSFADPRHGVALAYHVGVFDAWYTADAGRTWHRSGVSGAADVRPMTATRGGILMPTAGPEFLNPRDGWFEIGVGQQGPGLSEQLWVTHDGGATWLARALPQAVQHGSLNVTPGALFGVQLPSPDPDPGPGLPMLWRGQSWGASWTPVGRLPTPNGQVHFVDAHHGWLIGLEGGVGGATETYYVTDDGGATWAERGLVLAPVAPYRWTLSAPPRT